MRYIPHVVDANGTETPIPGMGHRTFRTIKDIQMWLLREMPRTHPHLRRAHIVFIEAMTRKGT